MTSGNMQFLTISNNTNKTFTKQTLNLNDTSRNSFIKKPLVQDTLIYQHKTPLCRVHSIIGRYHKHPASLYQGWLSH